MESIDRRESILSDIINSKKPLTGGFLAGKYNVTRQVIVQDIAILRAAGKEIIATPQGYILPRYHETKTFNRIIASKHDVAGMEDELTTIVSHGGSVLNVIIYHPLYGEFKGQLMISSIQDVHSFISRMNKEGAEPLSSLTEGVHLHTIEADSIEILDEIENALEKKGYLLSND